MSGIDVVLFSGGMDSGLALLYAARNADRVIAVTVDYGQKNLVRELAAAQAFVAALRKEEACEIEHVIPTCHFHRIMNTAFGASGDASANVHAYRFLESDYVPGRNALLISLAAAIGESLLVGPGDVRVHTGFIRSEYPDCSPAFVKDMEAALTTGSAAFVHVNSPLTAESKTRIRAGYNDMGALHLLDLTWSCYLDGETPCGECSACMAREGRL